MLNHLFEYLTNHISGFNLFHYITTRSILAAITSLLTGLIVGPYIIAATHRLKYRESININGPDSHLKKQGTPTMGGTLIVSATTITTLLWADLSNRYITILLITLLLFAWIGLVDDYRKLKSKNNLGLSAKTKYFWQSIAALIVVFWLYHGAYLPAQTTLIFPFFKNLMVELGPWFLLLGYFTVVGTSNGVNLSDGLDGLVVFPLIMITGALGIFAYSSGNYNFSQYLNIPFLPEAGETLIFASALAGSCLGFLWFNSYPAQIFMGDVGALSLGAAVGMLALIVRQELILIVMGGVFVVETMSVALQVLSYKFRKKRIFRMAPLHHHFELGGLSEPKLVVRFWIVTLLLVLTGLSSLKIR